MIKAFSKIVNAISITIGNINWTSKRVMTEDEFNTVREKLKDNYYIILTRHNGHMSSYAISIAHLFLSGRLGYYAHALMNLEDTVKDDSDYRFIEATGTGVHYSDFNEIFDQQCSSVALLKPKKMTIDEWTLALEKAREQLGKGYDTLFDIADSSKLSCVELVRVALSASPNYAEDFADFEARIAKNKNFDPETFRECTDFEVVYEVRH